MTVKKANGTTLSLIVLAAAIAYFLPMIKGALPGELLDILGARMDPGYTLGSLYPQIVKAAFWLIAAAGILDAILRNRVAFGLLSSFSVPIVIGIPVVIMALVQQLDLHIFWAILHVAAIVGLYWTFRKIIRNSRPGGQKLISFIKEIKDAGGAYHSHAVDHFTVWGTALLLLAADVIVVVSLAVFVVVYWVKLS